ncbi:MAG: protein-tyrosine phosphatase family protein [Candidatus Delongbacteria bacterium]|jgi:protein-tyrosine phosphatase|nr:protein-tyrosine phosphatase family protein [Candidatus Delongbacteria bacterium]
MYEIDFISLPGMTGRIGMGRAPGYGSDRHEDFRSIKAQGISKIYCLQEEDELQYLTNGEDDFEKRREYLTSIGIDFVSSPIGDFRIPTVEQAHELTDMILNDVKSGKDILIHCMGGLGRTGTIAGCTLVRFGIAPEIAVMTVRTVRPGTLETDQQLEFVTNSFNKS